MEVWSVKLTTTQRKKNVVKFNMIWWVVGSWADWAFWGRICYFRLWICFHGVGLGPVLEYLTFYKYWETSNGSSKKGALSVCESRRVLHNLPKIFNCGNYLRKEVRASPWRIKIYNCLADIREFNKQLRPIEQFQISLSQVWKNCQVHTCHSHHFLRALVTLVAKQL